MDKYIQQFPEQLVDALRIVDSTAAFQLPRTPKHVITSGMGGSGIGSAIVRTLISQQLTVPFAFSSDYRLPGWTNSDTLVLCSSYSGNTEETLSAMQFALDRGCMVVCVTSGGKMLEIAKEKNLPVVIIPGGRPPRSSIGYSIIAQLFLLQHCGIIDNSWHASMEKCIAFIHENMPVIREQAESLAVEIDGSIPVIYSDALLAGTAVRWKQQLNENAKIHAFTHVVPEMNHNELVAYYHPDHRINVICLRHAPENPRTAKRFSLMEELIQGKAGSIITVLATGPTLFEQIFGLIHLGDWLSVALAERKGVNPLDIEMLEWLKKALDK